MLVFYIIAFIFSVILGGLGHFLYEWSHHKKLAGLFFAVNESVWEHIKLGLTPMFIVFLVMLPFYGNASNYLIAKFLGILSFAILIPLLFYFYTYFTKKHILIVDIIIFVIALLVGYLVDYFLINSNYLGDVMKIISIIGLITIFICYLIFTFEPLKNFIFKDPITKKYGIDGHSHHKHDEH